MRKAAALLLAALTGLGLTGCTRASRAQRNAWAKLPPGAKHATRSTRRPSSADAPIGGITFYEISAEMTADDFRAWCAALDFEETAPLQERRAGQAPEPASLLKCMPRSGAADQEIQFRPAADGGNGVVHFIAS